MFILNPFYLTLPYTLEKTNEIKESTIKGLEPEVQSLIDSNKKDIKVLEEAAEVLFGLDCFRAILIFF